MLKGNYSLVEKCEIGLGAVPVTKKPIDRDENFEDWSKLNARKREISELLSFFGLKLVINDVDGYAVIRQMTKNDWDECSEMKVPKILNTVRYGYETSLLFIVLRKMLMNHELNYPGNRLIVNLDNVAETYALFKKSSADEKTLRNEVSSGLKKIADLKIIKETTRGSNSYEVKKVLKELIDVELMEEFLHKINRENEEGQE